MTVGRARAQVETERRTTRLRRRISPFPRITAMVFPERTTGYVFIVKGGTGRNSITCDPNYTGQYTKRTKNDYTNAKTDCTRDRSTACKTVGSKKRVIDLTLWDPSPDGGGVCLCVLIAFYRWNVFGDVIEKLYILHVPRASLSSINRSIVRVVERYGDWMDFQQCCPSSNGCNIAQTGRVRRVWKRLICCTRGLFLFWITVREAVMIHTSIRSCTTYDSLSFWFG